MTIGVKKLFSCMLLAAFLLAGCDDTVKNSPVNDVLTQRVIPQGKIPVTILVKNAFPINIFEEIAEKLFPTLDIIQVGNYTSDRGLVEYERRLQHDDLTDIVMTWPLGVGEKYWPERLLDLSSMPFSGKYNVAMLNKISTDGSLYYLPGPAQIRGIVYNKTMFQENGWEVPHDFESFMALCKKIEASGMRSLQLGLGNPEVLDTAFVGFSYGTSFSSPADAQWLADYSKGKGSFGEHFGPAFDTFQAMIEAGIWHETDLIQTYADREAMFFNRECAMIEDSALMTRMGRERANRNDEYGLMPFFNATEPSDWARLYMVCYIGLNKHLAEEANKEKYELILQLMDYISTPEGQVALAADTGAMYSSVKNAPAPHVPEITDLIPTLEQGRVAIFPELYKVQDALREGLAGMLAGMYTREEVIHMVDEQNYKTAAPEVKKILATASADFSLIETGNLVTDIMRQKTGADVALFLDNGKDGRYNGKGLSARLYSGPQTLDDIYRILPDTKLGERSVLQVAQLSGADLIHILEYSLPVNHEAGWFYYFSGLRMEYAPAAEPGTRIRKITDLEGNGIDPERIYSVAIMDQTIPENRAQSIEDTGILLSTLLADTFLSAETIAPSGDGRFTLR